MPERSEPQPTVDLNDPLAAGLVAAFSLDSGPPLPAEAATRYRVDGEIGHGGMGSVQRGYDPHMGRDIAIKVLLEKHADNLELRRRFVEEAQIGGQLQHPGVVPVYELGQSPDQRPYFTMKLVKGQTLTTLLAARATPQDNLPRFLTIFEQVCQTVAYAHARRVIHRDLKPSNIMVGSFGEVQVMDWGLAKVLPPTDSAPAETAPVAEITNIRTVADGSTALEQRVGTLYGMGTLGYMPPEQALGEAAQIDERADVFALGAILCCILTGRPPYVGNAAELRRQTNEGNLTVAFARLESSGSDPELLKLCKECLTVDLQTRLPNAGVVAVRMTAYQAGVQERLRQAELAHAAEVARTEEAMATAAQERKARQEAQARAVAERRARRLTMGLAASVLLLLAGGGGAGFWFIERMAATDKAVSLALAKVDDSRSRAEALVVTDETVARAQRLEWQNAEAALAEADAALKTGTGTDGMRQRVATAREQIERGKTQAQRKEKLFHDLDAARMAKATWNGSTGKPNFVEEAGKYDEAFVAYGLDVRSGQPEELARRIRDEELGVREALIVALDGWAEAERRVAGKRSPADLQAIALTADDDPWRKKFRAAVIAMDRSGLPVLSEEASRLALPPTSLLLLADTLYQRDERKEALAVLRKARTSHPTDFWIHFSLGLFLAPYGKALSPLESEEALGCYRAALALRPRAIGALINLGLILSETHKDDEALLALRKAIELDPAFPIAYANLGTLLLNKKHMKEAIAAYRKAIDLDPKHADFHCSLGFTLVCNNQLEDGIAEYKKAIELDPKHAPAHVNLGNALEEKNQLDDAIAEQMEAIKLDPKLAPAYISLGTAQLAKSQLDDAIAAFRTAIALNPNDARPHNNLGYALSNKLLWDDAIVELVEAIGLDASNAAAYVNLGNARSAKGQLIEAIAAYHKAIEIEPKSAPSHDNLGVALEAIRITAGWL